MAGAFIYKKKPLNFLYPKMTCAYILLKLAQWFWKRRLLKFVNVFSLFRNKGNHMETTSLQQMRFPS